jgi:SWIM zinc finger
MRAPGADPASRLVSTMIDVLVAELTDAGRLRRGREYARQGAVGPLTVGAGMVSAVVQGSRPEPYVATARVTLVEPAGNRLAGLVPGRRDVRFSCTCPDDGLCKHAVALMTVFSERLAYYGSLFVRWRTGAEVLLDDPTGRETTAWAPAGSRSPVPAARAFGDDERAALATFLGDGQGPPPAVPELASIPGPRGAWDDVWAEMLTAALDALRRPVGVDRRR